MDVRRVVNKEATRGIMEELSAVEVVVSSAPVPMLLGDKMASLVGEEGGRRMSLVVWTSRGAV